MKLTDAQALQADWQNQWFSTTSNTYPITITTTGMHPDAAPPPAIPDNRDPIDWLQDRVQEVIDASQLDV